MRACVLLFAIGAWILQQQAELPILEYAWLLSAAAPALYLARRDARWVRCAGEAMIGIVALGAGFFWAAALAHGRMSDALASEWEGRDIEIVGVVASLPQPFERSVRFDLDVEQTLTSGAHVPQRITLSW